MRRRQFIAGLGSAAAAWPLAVRAQQPKRPVIGFVGADASAWTPWTAAFAQRLRGLGWIENRTVEIEYRWSEGRPERIDEIAGGTHPKLENLRINPMQSKSPMHLSRRCGVRTRQGSRCQSPAMPNGRCRLHSGKSPGAPKGNRNAFKHGRYSAERIEARRKIAALLQTMRTVVRASLSISEFRNGTVQRPVAFPRRPVRIPGHTCPVPNSADLPHRKILAQCNSMAKEWPKTFPRL
jgi:hypothetical protein